MTPCSIVFVVDFEHVIAGWVIQRFHLCFFRCQEKVRRKESDYSDVLGDQSDSSLEEEGNADIHIKIEDVEMEEVTEMQEVQLLQEVASSEKVPPFEEFHSSEHLLSEEVTVMEGVSVLGESDR